MNLLIKNGTILFNNKFVKKDILVNKFKIFRIDDSINFDCDTIDATGLHVIPGLIDIHVHFRDFGQEHKETWKTASKAAISGGVTTVFDMPNNLDPITTIELYNKKLDAVKKKTQLNFGLYMAVTNDNIEQINNSKIKFVKLYHGETVGKINVENSEEIFQKLNKNIFMIAHAEDNSIINLNKKKYTGKEINYHSLIRNNEAEYVAVKELLNYSEKYDRQIHITHVSCKESIELIKQAKDKGLKVTCDTCCHYLFLDDSLYDKIGLYAKVNPALKSIDNQKILWESLNNGVIDCLCSDHAPHTIQEKEGNYNNVMAGFPGVETTSRLMLTAVNDKKITFQKFVNLMTKNPAKIIKIKQKGEIKEGFDADFAIIDLQKEDIIDKVYTKANWTPYKSMKTKGKVIKTIVQGKFVYDKGNFYE
jgi:dihydroorotase (multifunctional complex type)